MDMRSSLPQQFMLLILLISLGSQGGYYVVFYILVRRILYKLCRLHTLFLSAPNYTTGDSDKCIVSVKVLS